MLIINSVPQEQQKAVPFYFKDADGALIERRNDGTKIFVPKRLVFQPEKGFVFPVQVEPILLALCPKGLKLHLAPAAKSRDKTQQRGFDVTLTLRTTTSFSVTVGLRTIQSFRIPPEDLIAQYACAPWEGNLN